MPEPEENPVANGLVALITVATVVGVLAAIAVLSATNVLGISGSTGDGGNGAADDGFFMPEPVATTRKSGALVTLLSPDSSPKKSKSGKASKSPSPTKSEEEDTITLSQGASEVASGAKLYLSGLYPTGEGSVLDIEQRRGGGSWVDFPVDANVSGGTFAVYVSTSATGDVEWRMVDKSRSVKSNVVEVKHGG